MMQDLNLYPKISPYVVKRFEPALEKYFFYNAKDKTFWNCDFSMGAVLSCFDGSLSVEEILEIVSNNNPETDKNEIREKILETLEFLLAEGFVNAA